MKRTAKRRQGRVSKGRRQVILACEKLEPRMCLASVELVSPGLDDARFMRDTLPPGPRVVYYDYVEDGVLKGGRVDQDLIEPWCPAVLTKSDISAFANSVTTVMNNGPTSNRIDLTIVGDGYTSAQLGDYATHLNNILPTFFAEEPLATYKSFFNVHRVNVVSTQSGVDNDPTQGVQKNTALDMGYWGSGIERLLIINTSKAAAAAASAPDTDQILALANSTKYGGAGYPGNDLGTVAGNNSFAIDVALHEFGHSFADLADEYDYADGSRYTGGEFVEPNVSIKTAAQMQNASSKWHRWLPEANVDAFEGGHYNQFGVYRPTTNSKMRSLGQPFEQVNIEQFVISAYKTVQPIDSATAAGTYSASKVLSVNPVDPIGHKLDIQWRLNGNLIAGQTSGSLDVSLLNLPAGSHTIQVKVVDNTPFVRDPALRNQWLTETRSWTINAIANTKPVISNFGPAVSYTENATPTKIATSATITDSDSPSFATGRLYARIQSGAQPTDRLTIVPSTTVTLNGNQVLVSGTVVGTFSGGTSTSPLIVSLAAGASLSRVQTLMRSIGFSSTSENPSTTTRTISMQVTDGEGGASVPVSKSLTVTRVNDRPVIGGISGTLNYTQNAAAIRVATAATVSDVDSSNFAGGVLTLSIIAGAHISNRLELTGSLFTVDAANKVYRNGVWIGTRNAGAGIGTTQYAITLTSAATPAIAQELIRAFGFRTVAGTSTVQRTIAFKITDGDGGTSLTVNRLVNVS